MQREKVQDVVARVRKLLGPEGAARPVGVRLILPDAYLEHPLEQHAEPDLEAVAEEGRLDLRVHHAAHRPPHEGGEDLEVLSAAV